jgi:hypothetical protein
MEQWDAIHAMWIYEMMELENPQNPKTDFWKPGSRAKGVKVPFVIKVRSGQVVRPTSFND